MARRPIPSWTCYARPVAKGRTCHATNYDMYAHFCQECGATRHAGQLRFERGDIDPPASAVTKRNAG